MKSLRSHEGVMTIDNRNSQGVDDALMLAMGYPAGSGHGLFESATYTCSHCESIVVIEPKRTRARGYCPKCSRMVCDACETERVRRFECRSWTHMLDEMQEADLKRAASVDAPSILLP